MPHATILSDREMTAISKALGDPRRFGMLREIAEAGALCCQTMRAAQPVSAATISHHVKELEAAGLIEIARAGKFATLHFRRETMQLYLRQLGAVFTPCFGGFNAPLESVNS